MPKPLSPTQRVVALTLIAALLLLSIISIAGIINASNQYQVTTTKEKRGKTNGTTTKQEWESAKKQLDTSLAIAPRDPETLYSAAKLYIWREETAPLNNSSGKEELNTAQEYLTQSLQQRPLWPHTWSRLSVVLAKQKEFGPLFQTAFQNTIKLGHQEKKIQALYVKFGLHAWGHLTRENKKEYLSFLQKVAPKNIKTLTTMEHTSQTRLIMCFLLKDLPRIQRYCESR